MTRFLLKTRYLIIVPNGAGIALPIAALGLFVGLRAWSAKAGKERSNEKH